MIVVVDASVAAMWFLPEPQSDAAALLLDSGHDLVAPDLVRLEVGSALLKAVRRGELDAAEAAEALSRLSAPTMRFEPLGIYLESAFALSQRHGGSIYDGTYIAVAKALDATVATNDAQLARTARSAEVRAWLMADPVPPGLAS